jgi:hypothetical protein
LTVACASGLSLGSSDAHRDGAASSDSPLAPPPDAPGVVDAIPGADGTRPDASPDAAIDGGPDATNQATAHLLLSEICATPSAAEFIEIYNPTALAIDLSNYYLADRNDYYRITIGVLNQVATDFVLRFPAGATIGPGQYQVLALHGAQGFQQTFGMLPTYEVLETSAAVPNMRPGLIGAVGAQYGLTDTDELVMLFYWDGQNDLVRDVDYVHWGQPTSTNPLVDKSGITIDGIDSDLMASSYLPDTPVSQQAPLAVHQAGGSYHRCNFSESGEPGNGNGITGEDETGEPLPANWKVNVSTPSQRTPGAGPPAGLCP